MVQVQTILYSSLAASLLSAFLAMLGKQWLNRYASTDMRGSAVQRSQNRQRKLDGIVTWYFDYVMESLPLMLQVALLLLGCALSRYLWEVNSTIASVVIGVTSFGLLFYLFIVAVGTAWESCPYQTPGSTFFRYLGPRVLRITREIVHSAVSATGNIFKASKFVDVVTGLWKEPEFSPRRSVTYFLAILFLGVPIAFAFDIYFLGRAIVERLSALFTEAHRPLRRVYAWLHPSSHGPDQRTAALDLRCILWTLQKSLEQDVHISTLNHLITITEYTDFDSNLVMDCFNIFLGYISVSNGKVMVTQGLGQLAMLSATCFFQTLDHLSATHPTSSVLTDLRRGYDRIFPLQVDFRGLPFYQTMAKIHVLINQDWSPRTVGWTDYRPADQELVPFARHMVEVARAEYQRMQARKLPRWILRFALHVLSLDPSPPPSVIADSLTIVAIALDHDPLNVLILDERYIFSNLLMPIVLTKDQCKSGASVELHHSEARNNSWGP
jgi:hypothetical protein